MLYESQPSNNFSLPFLKVELCSETVVMLDACLGEFRKGMVPSTFLAWSVYLMFKSSIN